MRSMLINYKTTSCEHWETHIAVIKFPLPKANMYIRISIQNTENILSIHPCDNHFLIYRLISDYSINTNIKIDIGKLSKYFVINAS